MAARQRQRAGLLAAVALNAACATWRAADVSELRATGQRARVTTAVGERFAIEVHGVRRREIERPVWAMEGPWRPNTTTDILGRDLRTGALLRLDVRDLRRIEVRRPNSYVAAAAVLLGLLGLTAYTVFHLVIVDGR